MLALILPFLPTAIRAIESLVKGRRKGNKKKDIVIAMILTILDGLSRSGQLAGATVFPSKKELGEAIDLEHRRLTDDGTLQTAPAPWPGDRFIVLTPAELIQLIQAARSQGAPMLAG